VRNQNFSTEQADCPAALVNQEKNILSLVLCVQQEDQQPCTTDKLPVRHLNFSTTQENGPAGLVNQEVNIVSPVLCGQKKVQQTRTTDKLLVHNQTISTAQHSPTAGLERPSVSKKKRVVVSCPLQLCYSSSTVPWSLDWLSQIPIKDVMAPHLLMLAKLLNLLC